MARQKHWHSRLVACVDEALPTSKSGEVRWERGVVRDEHPPFPTRSTAQSLPHQICLPR